MISRNFRNDKPHANQPSKRIFRFLLLFLHWKRHFNSNAVTQELRTEFMWNEIKSEWLFYIEFWNAHQQHSELKYLQPEKCQMCENWIVKNSWKVVLIFFSRLFVDRLYWIMNFYSHWNVWDIRSWIHGYTKYFSGNLFVFLADSHKPTNLHNAQCTLNVIINSNTETLSSRG